LRHEESMASEQLTKRYGSLCCSTPLRIHSLVIGMPSVLTDVCVRRREGGVPRLPCAVRRKLGQCLPEAEATLPGTMMPVRSECCVTRLKVSIIDAATVCVNAASFVCTLPYRHVKRPIHNHSSNSYRVSYAIKQW